MKTFLGMKTFLVWLGTSAVAVFCVLGAVFGFGLLFGLFIRGAVMAFRATKGF